MNKILLFLIILFVSVSFSSSEVEVGFGEETGQTGVNIEIPEEIIITPNASVNYSNSTDWWNTGDHGSLRNVGEIEHNWLSNLLWSVAGHVFDTNVNFAGYDIFNIGNVNATTYYGDGSKLDGIVWTNDSDQIFIKPGYPDDLNVSNVLFVNGTSNKTGIGTDSPTQKLDVSGGAITVDNGVFGYRIKDTTGFDRLFAKIQGSKQTIGAESSTVGDMQINAGQVGGAVGAIYIKQITGNIGLGTNTPSSKLNVIGDGNFTGTLYASNVSSNSPLQLQTGGTTRIYVDDSTGFVGVGTNNPEFKLTIDNDGGIIAIGSTGAGETLTTSGAGTRLIWYPRKAAFRAGETTGTQWDDVNIAPQSVAMGGDTIASGDLSTAFGWLSTASGDVSTAMGAGTVASGDVSTAMGVGTTASGDYSIASGGYSTAQSYASVVIGRYNVISGTTDSWVATDPVFVIGNGVSAGSPSNAVTVLKNGKFGIGTDSPQNALNVIGDGNFSGTLYASNVSSNSPLQLQTNGTTRIYVDDSTGNVGIGATSPQRELHVNGSILSNATINATGDICIEGGQCLSRFNGVLIGSGTEMYIPLWNGTDSLNNSEIYQGGNGNIGIGTIDPEKKLDVSGSIKGSDLELRGGGPIVYFNDTEPGNDDWRIWLSGSNLYLQQNVGDVNLTSRMFLGSTGKVGINTTSPEFKLTLTNDGGILANGTFNSGESLITNGSGTRLIWYPRKAAFRAGRVTSTQWDNVNIGDYSAAFGRSTQASGAYSFAAGVVARASGSKSTAFGEGQATAGSSIAMGEEAEAAAFGSAVVGGDTNLANGTEAAVVGGVDNIANGTRSFVSGGRDNIAGGSDSYAFGKYMQLTSNANNTFVFGTSSTPQSISTPNAFLIFPAGDLGNVGIGTLTPSAKLDVNGTSFFSGDMTINKTGDLDVTFRATGATSDVRFNLDGENTAQLIFKDTGVSKWLNYLASEDWWLARADGNDLLQAQQDGTLTLWNVISPFNTIDFKVVTKGLTINGGNVGIDTDNPLSTFQIGDGSAGVRKITVRNAAATADNLALFELLRVGSFRGYAAATNAGMALGVSGPGITGDSDANDFSSIFIDHPTKNVGIGEALISPQAKLDTTPPTIETDTFTRPFPSINTTQRNALTGLVEGAGVYDTTENNLRLYDGSKLIAQTPKETVYVYDLDDLPDVDGNGRIPLEFKTYVFPTATPFVLPYPLDVTNGAIIKKGVIVYVGSGAMFYSANMTDNLIFDFTTVIDNSETETLFNITATNPNINILPGVSAFVGFNSLGTIEGATLGTYLVKFLEFGTGLSLDDAPEIAIYQTGFISTKNASTSYLTFDGTTPVTNIVGNTFILGGSNNKIFDFKSTFDSDSVAVSSNTAVLNGGDIFNTSSFDQTTVGYKFSGNVNIPDSTAKQAAYFNSATNLTTIISTDTPVKVNASWNDNEIQERFNHSGDGRWCYVGLEDTTVNVDAKITLDPTSGAASDWTTYIYYNGVIQNKSKDVKTIGTGTAVDTANSDYLFDVSNGDCFEVWIERNTDVGNVIATDGRIKIFRV